MADIVEHNVPTERCRAADGPLTVYVTGPAATVADLTVAGQQDRLPIELAIAVLVLAVLLVVYRSSVTMLLPLVTIGSSLVIAQAVAAGYSQLTGAGVSNQSIVFLSAIMAGAGTDYAVFLISRYHDYLRSGADYDQAVKAAMISIGKVITASATTVGITFLVMSFAQMGVFRTVGVSSAIGIGVAYLAGVTLLPAILVLVGPRGWVKPRRELTARFWRRSGIRIVRRPVPHLVASVLVLILLASCAGFARFNYDDRKAVSASAPSSVGYAALERHFPISQSIPQYILVQSPRDLRSPQALADLEQMASRIAQLPDVSLVSGITRPLGEVPPEFRATFQAGIVGDRLAAGSAQIGERTGDLNKLTAGADTLADSLGDVRAQVNTIAPSIQSLIDAFSSVQNPIRRRQVGAGRRDRCQARRQHQQARHRHGRELRGGQGHVRLDRPRPGGAAGQRGLRRQSLVQRHPRSSSSGWSPRATTEASTEINQLAGQLQGVEDRQTLTATVNQLNGALAKFTKALSAMGLDRTGRPPGGSDRPAARRQPPGRRKPASGRRR